ncbi:hypothetical protein ACU639_11530 [Streptomyces cynarae]|uniref:hypothetical protein n=1 Tax=Streptomyces cynarae TaxID=2981134 RepID=UPI00406D290B
MARATATGSLPAGREPGNRLVRTVAASAVLDAVYAVVAGPWLIHPATTDRTHGVLGGLATGHVRQGWQGPGSRRKAA